MNAQLVFVELDENTQHKFLPSFSAKNYNSDYIISEHQQYLLYKSPWKRTNLTIVMKVLLIQD
jgi:hypothetical protein